MKGKSLLIGKFVVIGIVTVLVLLPTVWLVVTSFKYPIEAARMPPTFLPHRPTLRAYVALFTGKDPRGYILTPIMTNFANSIIVGLSTTLVSLVLGIGAAYSISRKKVIGGMVIFSAILFMRTIPRIAIAIPLFMWLRKMNLINTLSGISMVHITIVFPIIMFIMYNFFKNVPIELEDAALVDGCSSIGAFVRIILPLSTPAIAVSIILSFIFSFNEFLYALILLSTNAKMTLPIALAFFVTGRGIDWDLLSAAATLALVPMVILFLFIQKYIISGLMTGALKK